MRLVQAGFKTAYFHSDVAIGVGIFFFLSTEMKNTFKHKLLVANC